MREAQGENKLRQALRMEVLVVHPVSSVQYM